MLFPRLSARVFVSSLLLCLWTATLADAQATKPVVTQPASQPVDAAVHNLAARIRQLNNEQLHPPKVAFFDLNTSVVEKPADFSLLGGNPGAITLQSLLGRLHHARDDKDVRAVLVTLGDPKTNLAMSQEIRDALLEIKHAKKRVFVYADGYDTDSYTIATGATDVCLLLGGEIMIPGVGIQTMYLKGLFDKLGVQADYVQVGVYKGADEQFTRTEASREFTGELNKLMDGLYDQVVQGISQNRKLSIDQVKAIVDESVLSAQAAKDRGLVDHLVDMDGLRDLMADQIGEGKVDLIPDYDAAPKDSLDFSSPFALLSMLSKKPAASSKPAVALVYADGVIVDGPGGIGLLGGASIGSDSIREAMRQVGRDDSVKAVVIRINSPGGSALASEVMWQAVRRVVKNKPVIISVGNMAASGGYYLASAGEHIFADPAAIVGSIGVVGGKFVTKDLFDKLGITTENFVRGRNADMFGSDTKFTDEQRGKVRGWMTQTYDQFTARVMTTRQGKIKKIEDVAQGRVFVASQAKDLGMVDEIGGLDTAIVYAANQAHLKPEKYDVRVVPAARTLADIINGTPGTSAESPVITKISMDGLAVLQAMPAETRAMVAQQLQILQLLQQRPVVLAAPFVIRER